METIYLRLIPHHPKHLLALVNSVPEYEAASGMRVAEGIRDFLLAGSPDFFVALRHGAEPDPWKFGFAVVHKIDNVVIGMCGFSDEPDENKCVEIAYGITPAYEGRGYATEVAAALVQYASNSGRVTTICAHTLRERNASTHVLEKCGFRKTGEMIDAENNLVWRWERSTSSPLHPSPDEMRKWGNAAVETMASYLGSIRERRVYPETSSRAIREKLDRALPLHGTDFEHLLEKFRELVDLSRQNGHPRMFGYVQAPGTAIAAIADLLASTLNANLTAWRSAPAAVEVERLTIDWIKQILGYHEHAAGLLVSGGSMANMAALAVARRAKAPPDFASKGAQSVTQTMRVYVSTETHHSIAKAAALLGIGRENVREVRADDRYKIDINDLVANITEDLAAGHLPFCVVANVGTVMTGAFDPLAEVAEIARRFNLWMHVDACYGGFAALAESVRPLFAAIDQADSVALDPHKWLYLPIDCGCVLYRDPQTARATFAHDADYTRIIAQEAEEAFAFWDYGPELSRRFRALKIWMLLKTVGCRALGEVIEKDLACARHFEQLILASNDFEMLAPVEMSIFCFRHLPNERKVANDQELDAWNERLLVALQRDGSSYLSNALIHGRFALRGCVMNYRTTLRDMEILLDDLQRVARSTSTS
ncbi:MAG: GNAT family N-acetyltransferase [Spartobacteria bacterium]